MVEGMLDSSVAVHNSVAASRTADPAVEDGAKKYLESERGVSGSLHS